MSELFEPVDAHDRDLALRTPGLLGAFNAAGVLTAADVHLGVVLGDVGGESDERVLLAAALAARAVRHGSICVDLDLLRVTLGEELEWPEADGWRAAVAASPLLALGVLRLENDLLYLDRYHEQESQVLDDLAARSARAVDSDAGVVAAALDRVFPAPRSPGEADYTEQREAAARAAAMATPVLTGGPGTGKTTAVAGLLVALHAQAEAAGRAPRIALTAPTGRAAAQLQGAVGRAAAGYEEADRARLAGLEAMTLHRLLGPDPGNPTRFRHHRGNRLPHDVIVVDETSMVSLTMMARLLEAVRPECRLVLVGDPDQLSSVDAGAVLSDLVAGYGAGPASPVLSLTRTHRYPAEIGDLATALRDGDADRAVEVLRRGDEQVQWLETDDPVGALRGPLMGPVLALRDAAAGGSDAAVLAALGRQRLLCAHRDGPRGVRWWNRQVEQWLAEATGADVRDPAYVGRPLLVTANDRTLGVWNGDYGVVVERDGARRVLLPGADGTRLFAGSRLGDVETMHAMTIHKSQGSQAAEVTVLLPDVDSRLLTRELFYTAVTRAERMVRVVGTEAEVRAAIERQAQRASGLAARLGAL